MERPVYVWRLVITYPEASREPGWTPDCWEEILAEMPWRKRRAARKRGFRWPRERLFLSGTSASRRHWHLIRCGAKVDVQRSDAITWNDTRELAEAGITSRWGPFPDVPEGA